MLRRLGVMMDLGRCCGLLLLQLLLLCCRLLQLAHELLRLLGRHLLLLLLLLLLWILVLGWQVLLGDVLGCIAELWRIVSTGTDRWGWL